MRSPVLFITAVLSNTCTPTSGGRKGETFFGVFRIRSVHSPIGIMLIFQTIE
jgi:hypothetical protein